VPAGAGRNSSIPAARGAPQDFAAVSDALERAHAHLDRRVSPARRTEQRSPAVLRPPSGVLTRVSSPRISPYCVGEEPYLMGSIMACGDEIRNDHGNPWRDRLTLIHHYRCEDLFMPVRV
jgi:hypothetical protein